MSAAIKARVEELDFELNREEPESRERDLALKAACRSGAATAQARG